MSVKENYFDEYTGEKLDPKMVRESMMEELGCSTPKKFATILSELSSTPSDHPTKAAVLEQAVNVSPVINMSASGNGLSASHCRR